MADLRYKDGWDEAKRHFTAWWDGKSLGRPAMGLCAVRKEPLPFKRTTPAERMTTPKEAVLNAAWRMDNHESWLCTRHLMGEFLPNFSLDIGPGSLALYLGCEPGFSWETVWFEACMKADDPESYPFVSYDSENRWWKTHLDMVKYGAERVRGKGLMTVPDLVEGLDILAAMRDPQRLLFDLYDRPAWVHRWLDRLDGLYFDYFDRIYDVVKDENGGNAFTAFQVWAPGRMAKVQCDFCYMIGPDMFAEFVAPYLARQCARLDYAVYHLDGPNCIPHVQHLVKIPKLNAIQWTPGAGAADLGDPCWYDLYHEVRAGGKGLLLLGVRPDLIQPLLKEFGPDGMYIMPSKEFDSPQAATDFMHQVEDWCN